MAAISSHCKMRGKVFCFYLLLLASIFLPLSLASGQWLETTIYVPDSLCGVIGAQALTYNTANNKIYVGGEVELSAVELSAGHFM